MPVIARVWLRHCTYNNLCHFSSLLHMPCRRRCVLSLRCFSTNKRVCDDNQSLTTTTATTTTTVPTTIPYYPNTVAVIMLGLESD